MGSRVQADNIGPLSYIKASRLVPPGVGILFKDFRGLQAHIRPIVKPYWGNLFGYDLRGTTLQPLSID